jgi:hypothetical protein
VHESHLLTERCDSRPPYRGNSAENQGSSAAGFVLKGAIAALVQAIEDRATNRVKISWVIVIFGEHQVMAQLIVKRVPTSPLINKDFPVHHHLPGFSALCSRPGFMRPPGEIPMKVLMSKGFLAMRSHASKPCLSIRERAGTRLTSMPVMPGGTGRRHRGQTFFRFTYFHGLSAARPLGWPLRMTNRKVRILCGPGQASAC